MSGPTDRRSKVRNLPASARPGPRHLPASSLGDLSQRIAEIETRLSLAGGARDYSDTALAAVAERLYRARRRRTRHFPALFAEPAWDMLLDLFVARVRGTLVSTTSLCVAGAVPDTTGKRWIRMLEDRGLVERHRANDRRVTPFSLTDRGYLVMRQYLIEGVEARELPPIGGLS